ncbi:MAG: sigma-70 family RNA polymerase sigma factor [Chloroflexi bacterium]|nr:sigma-70 family RNA polymerase sigma factor [Chloroflexota bacterium]
MQGYEVDDLVRRAQARDRAAFGELYALYGRKIYAYIVYSLNGRAHLAEDLTEEVFLKALENIDSYRFTGAPFSAWLYRIAHNHIVDYLRAQRKEPVLSLDSGEPYRAPFASDEEFLELRLDSQGLKEALRKLTEEQRNVILLRFVQDQSIADTARIVGKGEDAVKKLQSRALRSLKRILSREADDDG